MKRRLILWTLAGLLASTGDRTGAQNRPLRPTLIPPGSTNIEPRSTNLTRPLNPTGANVFIARAPGQGLPLTNPVPPFTNPVPPFTNPVPPFTNPVPPFTNPVPPFTNWVRPFISQPTNFIPPGVIN